MLNAMTATQAAIRQIGSPLLPSPALTVGPVQTDPMAIYGTSGNDTMYAPATGTFENEMRLYGGAGDDKLYGSTGDDLLDGGAGNDQLFGVGGHDSLYGGAGDDKLFGGGDFDSLIGGAGNDLLKAAENSYAHLEGGQGNDTLIGSAQGGWFDAGVGNDFLYIANGGANDEDGVYIGGDGWDVAILEHGHPNKDVWIEKDQFGIDTLHWFNWKGQEQTDTVYQIEQFNVGGVLYAYDQLLV